MIGNFAARTQDHLIAGHTELLFVVRVEITRVVDPDAHLVVPAVARRANLRDLSK